MCTCLISRCKPCRISLVLVLTALLSAWTCTAIIDFNSCTDAVIQPRLTSLSPDTISANAVPVLLIVNGTGFSSQSEILWNGSPLQTTFTNSAHLQATVTQQTFESFGGLAGGTVLISVLSPAPSGSLRCSDSVSGTLALFIE